MCKVSVVSYLLSGSCYALYFPLLSQCVGECAARNVGVLMSWNVWIPESWESDSWHGLSSLHAAPGGASLPEPEGSPLWLLTCFLELACLLLSWNKPPELLPTVWTFITTFYGDELVTNLQRQEDIRYLTYKQTWRWINLHYNCNYKKKGKVEVSTGMACTRNRSDPHTATSTHHHQRNN